MQVTHEKENHTTQKLKSLGKTLRESHEKTGLKPILILDLDDTLFIQTDAVRSVATNSVWNEIRVLTSQVESRENFLESVDEIGLLKTMQKYISNEAIPTTLDLALRNPLVLAFVKDLPLHSNMKTLLESLKDRFSLVLQTSTSKALSGHKFRMLGISEDIFDTVVMLEKNTKTPEDFERSLEKAGWKKGSEQQIVSIGNSLEYDILPALNIAHHTVLISNNTNLAAPDKTIQIGEASQLMKLL
ncbi:HAD family hydrolase [bacterium]|nr:HAD family hydrolase [bacterium]